MTKCPACGAGIEMPRTEEREFADGMISAVVVTDPGTFHTHLRDAHPDFWAESCELQRAFNANRFIGAMPRKVDGTFLRPGEDVSDIAVRSADEIPLPDLRP